MDSETIPLVTSSSGKHYDSSKSDDDLLQFETKTRKAAYLIRDAINLSNSNKSIGKNLPASKSPFRFLVQLSIVGLVLLTFVEPPTWCEGLSTATGTSCDQLLSSRGKPLFYVDKSEIGLQDYYPNTGTIFLSAKQSLYIQSIFLSVIAMHTCLSCFTHSGNGLRTSDIFSRDASRSSPDDPSLIQRQRMTAMMFFIILRTLSLVLLLKGMLTTRIQSAAFMYRMLIYISFSEAIQAELFIISKIIPSLLTVLLGLLLVIIIYAMAGVAWFHDTTEGAFNFDNLIDSMWTLFTSMTTVIYPDVMMAGYNQNRFVSFYFVSYMIITFFFFQNVILGLICNVHNEYSHKNEKLLELVQRSILGEAYDILTDQNMSSVSYEQMMAVFAILNDECDDVEYIPENIGTVLFAILDKNGSLSIERNEFEMLQLLLIFDFEDYDAFVPWIEIRIPFLRRSSSYRRFKTIILSTKFDAFVNIVLTINFVILVWQMFPSFIGQPMHPKDSFTTFSEDFEIFFISIYSFEMVSKMLTMGWRMYATTDHNLFDCFITIAGVISVFAVRDANDKALRYILIIRVLRVLRLCLSIRAFHSLSETFFGILPAASRVGIFLLCIVYVFSGIGMSYFGGKINRDPNSPYAEMLKGTEFATNQYWANNFNDLLGGINVCFNLLVINNWNEMESGIVAVSQSKFPRLYFLGFYFLGVILVNNLVVALVIQYFIEEFETSQQNRINGVFLEGNRCLIFDSDDLNSKIKFGKYIARLPPRYRLKRNLTKLMKNQLFTDRCK